MAHSPNKPVVFFDGHCNLCNGSVRFLLKNNPDNNLQFASLQSEVARQLLGDIPAEGSDPATLVLLENGQQYERSEAALRIAGYLKAPWRFGRRFLVVPRWLRDGIYNFVARNRFRWFGRSETCMMPTPETRSQFLQPEELASVQK